ncbi:MAG: hypothetical protein Q8O76_10545, partial [Chloroflexota bacterium]|nr:hypothetical protein [Chloroflexota bacterium]
VEAPTPVAGDGEKEVQTAVPSFRSGDRVRHPQFGEGIVIGSKPSGDDEEVAVAFVGMKPKRLLASFAKMEKLAAEDGSENPPSTGQGEGHWE